MGPGFELRLLGLVASFFTHRAERLPGPVVSESSDAGIGLRGRLAFLSFSLSCAVAVRSV